MLVDLMESAVMHIGQSCLFDELKDLLERILDVCASLILQVHVQIVEVC